MKSAFTKQEIEMLSAYVDGQLSPRDKKAVEKRLSEDNKLMALLVDFQWQKGALNTQPKIRAPRNFTLTPEMIGVSREKTNNFSKIPFFELVSALAVMLFVIVLSADLMSGGVGLGRTFIRAKQLNAMVVENAAPQDTESERLLQAPAYSAAEEQPMEKSAEEYAPAYDLDESAPEPQEILTENKVVETATPMRPTEKRAIDQAISARIGNGSYDWLQYFLSNGSWLVAFTEVLLVLIAIVFGVLAIFAYKSRRP